MYSMDCLTFTPIVIYNAGFIYINELLSMCNHRLTSADDYSRTFELCQMINEVVPRACSWTTMGIYPPCANYLR